MRLTDLTHEWPLLACFDVFDKNWHALMWHVTSDTWHVTHRRRWTFSQNFWALADTVFGVKVFWRFEGKGWLTDWINERMNYEDVCRTALVTPGLLIIFFGYNVDFSNTFLIQKSIRFLILLVISRWKRGCIKFVVPK